MPLAILQKQEVCGIVLIGLTEAEMEGVFEITTLGERRRLAGALRRLANRQGFGMPSTLAWEVRQVCAWLEEQGLGQLQEGFRSQSIDGEVLLTLTRDDLACLGVTTLGGKATLMSKIEQVKKLHYAGQAFGAGGGGTRAESGGAEQQRLVLEQVLQENAELAARLAAAREAADQGADAREPPDHFLCPITTEVMADPPLPWTGTRTSGRPSRRGSACTIRRR